MTCRPVSEALDVAKKWVVTSGCIAIAVYAGLTLTEGVAVIVFVCEALRCHFCVHVFLLGTPVYTARNLSWSTALDTNTFVPQGDSYTGYPLPRMLTLWSKL